MTVTAMPAAEGAAEEKKGGKKKKLIIVVVLLLVVLGGVYKFVLAPKPEGKPKPVAGVVVPLDPIQVNLAGGHYLNLGLALQLTDKASEADGSKALDAAIALFSGEPMSDLARREDRAKLKRELTKELDEAYEGEVMGVYFTQFVTQ